MTTKTIDCGGRKIVANQSDAVVSLIQTRTGGLIIYLSAGSWRKEIPIKTREEAENWGFAFDNIDDVDPFIVEDLFDEWHAQKNAETTQ